MCSFRQTHRRLSRLAGVVGLVVCAVGGLPTAHGSARLGPINASGGAGATLDIPVGFTSSEQITCLQFDVLFDPVKVTLGTARTGTAAPGHRIESRLMASDRQRVVIYSTTLAPLNGGYIVQLPVTWSAAGDSALALNAVTLANTEGTAVAFTSSTLAPAIAANGSGNTATAGSTNTLAVEATTGTGVTYQWSFNGQVIAGATSSTLALPNTQPFNAGTYSVVVTANGLTLNSQSFSLNVNPPAPNDGRLLNLSTRGFAQAGDNVLIPGFVVHGGTNKKLLIRAVGPTLVDLDPALNVVPDPTMQLKRRNNSGAFEDYATNDDWAANANATDIVNTAAAVYAFPLTKPKDAALLVDLPPGQYTVIAGDKTGTNGIASVELYDADSGSPGSRLINISNRGFAGPGERVMIPGFVISAEGPKTLLVRVVGPSLAQLGLTTGLMADPKLTIYSGSTPILENDNWDAGSDAAYTAQIAQQVFAFPLLAGAKDSAFVVTLQPGAYTIFGSSAVPDASGIILVELYVVQ